MSPWPHWPWLLSALVVLAGCAGPQATVARDPAQRLKERVAQYWDARIRGDLLVAYEFHEPAFRRAVTLTGFLQGRGVTHVSDYEILESKIEASLAIVKSKVKWTMTHPALVKPVEPKWSEFEEQWVRVDGEWYRKFRFPIGDPYPPIDWDNLAAGSSGATMPPPSPTGR